MQIEHWPINPDEQREAEENYRTVFALRLQHQDPLSIIRELTFDGVVPNITVASIRRLFQYVEKHFLKQKLAGVGVEVGAGPLTFSSILATWPGVKKMYGIEICQPIVEELFPKVSHYVLGSQTEKVVGVVGSFDEMQLPDNSVDFIFDFFSLHHSLDINITLRECYRILKPGGFVLCFDKARPDTYSKADLDELLDATYGSDYNRHFGLSLEQKITRRMNGEREYRLQDWKQAFYKAGFAEFEDAYLTKTIGGGFFHAALKRILGLISPTLQKKVTSLLPGYTFSHKFILSDHNRIFAKQINPFRKEISLMIAYK